MFIFLIVALLFGWFLPLPIPRPWWVRLAGGLITLCGLWLARNAVRAQSQAHTSVDPYTPTTAIVTDGPYRFSRNPIYLGFVLLVTGIPLIFGFYWGAILSLVAIDAYNRLIISREEQYLEKKFGQSYLDYKSRVRRWL
jgi:protein-S-isoprenylcysteine O-methyltransferase Ste14